MNLPDHLKAHLAELRSDIRFHEIMKAIPLTTIRPYVPNKSSLEDAATALIYQSGRLAGQKEIMREVLGYDPTDRTTE